MSQLEAKSRQHKTQTGGRIFCSCVYLLISPMAPQTVAPDTTLGFNHHLSNTHSTKDKYCKLHKGSIFAGLLYWIILCISVSQPILSAPRFKNLAQSTPKLHRGWKTYPRLEMTIRSSRATFGIHRSTLFYLCMVCRLGRPVWTDSNADEAIKVPCLSQP